jgi:hypothetical protein
MFTIESRRKYFICVSGPGGSGLLHIPNGSTIIISNGIHVFIFICPTLSLYYSIFSLKSIFVKRPNINAILIPIKTNAGGFLYYSIVSDSRGIGPPGKSELAEIREFSAKYSEFNTGNPREGIPDAGNPFPNFSCLPFTQSHLQGGTAIPFFKLASILHYFCVKKIKHRRSAMTKKNLYIASLVILIAFPFIVYSYMGGNGYGNGTGNGNGAGNGTCNGTGNGNGNGNGNGTGNGNGPVINLLTGTPFSYSGTVVSIALGSTGMTLSTPAGNLDFYGVGPRNYWDSKEVEKPGIGDSVNVSGYTVDYNGVPRNVLFQVVVDGNTVQLRDATTGYPLWRNGAQGNGGGNGNNANGGGFFRNQTCPRYDILNGAPFTYEGDIISGGASSCAGTGTGIVIATLSGNVTVEGLGPWRFWQTNGTERPTVGDTIKVTGFTVN